MAVARIPKLETITAHSAVPNLPLLFASFSGTKISDLGFTDGYVLKNKNRFTDFALPSGYTTMAADFLADGVKFPASST